MQAGMERDFTESQAAVQAQEKSCSGERRAGRRSAPRVALERVQGRPRRGLEHLPYGQTLLRACLVQGRLRGDLIRAYKYLEGVSRMVPDPLQQQDEEQWQ